jgi:hypothetical protein
MMSLLTGARPANRYDQQAQAGKPHAGQDARYARHIP